MRPRAPAVRRAGRARIGLYPRLWLLVLASVALQVVLVEVSALRSVFQLGVPDVTQWLMALVLGTLPALAEGLLTRRELAAPNATAVPGERGSSTPAQDLQSDVAASATRSTVPSARRD